MTPARLDPARLARLRGAAQLLHRPAEISDPAEVARRAGPVQAQEPRAARLAFRARARGLSAPAIDRARSEERSLLRAWIMRRTVHLIASEDAGWLLGLFAEPLARQARKRLGDFGLDRRRQDRALELLLAATRDDGPLTRPELALRLRAAGFEAPEQIKVHLWVLSTVEGGLCLGPDRGGQTCLVPIADWLGELAAPPRELSLGELARRYIRAYGPASERDFARWSGLALGDARSGIERIAGELDQLRCGAELLLIPKGRPLRAARGPVVRLLGAFDNYNLGYRSREFAVAAGDVARIVPGGGIVRPTITVDGRFAGTWSSKRSGKRLAVEIEPFAGFDSAWTEAIEAEIDDLGRFEGLAAARA